MTPEEIRIEFHKRRRTINQTQLARTLGVSRQTIFLVIDRKIRTPRIREAIAKAIGTELQVVFPEEKPQGPQN